MKMKIRGVDPVDREIGARVRTYRLMRGLSQAALADELEVSFQQLQKYEKGANRISGGRLTKIAQALQVEPSILLGSETGKPASNGADELIALIDPDAMRLLKAFNRIREPVRSAILDLAETYANVVPKR
jgi:transcriptional regulator with XRE-family HTH domain